MPTCRTATLCIPIGLVLLAATGTAPIDPQQPVASDGTVVSAVTVPTPAAEPPSTGGPPSGAVSTASIGAPPAPPMVGPARPATQSQYDSSDAVGGRHVSDVSAFPYRAVVYITSSLGACSGWLFGPDVVATAGHCVNYGASTYWAEQVRVYPARDGTAPPPYGSCGAKRLYSVAGWVHEHSEAYDYGAIKLDCRVGEKAGWFGFGWQKTPLADQRSVTAGYPFDKGCPRKACEQWVSEGRVKEARRAILYYDNSTREQMSGSPVFVTSGPDSPRAIAIHTNGRHADRPAPHSTWSHGTLITRAVFQNLLAWKRGID
jgi:glutamyl endopeptidase